MHHLGWTYQAIVSFRAPEGFVWVLFKGILSKFLITNGRQCTGCYFFDLWCYYME